MRAAWQAEPAAHQAAPPPGRDARWRTLALAHGLPLALYLLLACLVTYPLIARPTTWLPGDGIDAYMNLWGYWWARRALLAGQSPFWTPLVYAPDGAPLYLHTLNLFNGLATLPVQLLLGVVAAYNAVVLLSLTLAAYCAHLLVTYVSGSRLAGVIGGVVYAFGSYHITHLLGHANLLASEGLPAYALCLVAAIDATGRRRTLLVLAGALALALTMLCDWQYVVFAALFALLYAGYAAAARRSVAPLAVAGATGLLWLPLALPLIVPTVAEIRSGLAGAPGSNDTFNWAADLASLLLPSPLHPWWGGWAERVSRGALQPANERAVFLGYLPLALAALGVWVARRRAAFWLLAALVFGVLALGPRLQVFQQSGFGPSRVAVLLPYHWLERLPVFDVLRVPARFALMTTLCLAVLAGLGLSGLYCRLRPRARTVAGAALPLLVAALLLEHMVLPYPGAAVPPVPDFYRQLAGSDEPGAILEIPFSLKRPASMYYQTVHGRPLVGGYLARRLAYPIRTLPPLAEPGPDITGTPDLTALGAHALQHSGVRWIVVLLEDDGLDRAGLPIFVNRYAVPTPIYQDDRVAVYRPRPPEEAAEVPLALLVGNDWHRLETNPDGTSMRWFGSSATFTAWNFGDVTESVALRFDARPFHQPRQLEVRLDGRSLGQWRVTGPQRFDIPLALAPGYHQIELRALEPPTHPVTVGHNSDGRPLTFSISTVAFHRGR